MGGFAVDGDLNSGTITVKYVFRKDKWNQTAPYWIDKTRGGVSIRESLKKKANANKKDVKQQQDAIRSQVQAKTSKKGDKVLSDKELDLAVAKANPRLERRSKEADAQLKEIANLVTGQLLTKYKSSLTTEDFDKEFTRWKNNEFRYDLSSISADLSAYLTNRFKTCFQRVLDQCSTVDDFAIERAKENLSADKLSQEQCYNVEAFFVENYNSQSNSPQVTMALHVNYQALNKFLSFLKKEDLMENNYVRLKMNVPNTAQAQTIRKMLIDVGDQKRPFATFETDASLKAGIGFLVIHGTPSQNNKNENRYWMEGEELTTREILEGFLPDMKEKGIKTLYSINCFGGTDETATIDGYTLKSLNFGKEFMAQSSVSRSGNIFLNMRMNDQEYAEFANAFKQGGDFYNNDIFTIDLDKKALNTNKRFGGVIPERKADDTVESFDKRKSALVENYRADIMQVLTSDLAKWMMNNKCRLIGTDDELPFDCDINVHLG